MNDKITVTKLEWPFSGSWHSADPILDLRAESLTLRIEGERTLRILLDHCQRVLADYHPWIRAEFTENRTIAPTAPSEWTCKQCGEILVGDPVTKMRRHRRAHCLHVHRGFDGYCKDCGSPDA